MTISFHKYDRNKNGICRETSTNHFPEIIHISQIPLLAWMSEPMYKWGNEEWRMEHTIHPRI